MGNQGHANEPLRTQVDWIRAGVLGQVHDVHLWTNRPIWPQGADRPTDTPPVPTGLDWDLWLGTAPQRPYSPAYHPFKWRGFWDFGTGALGDMGCHIIDIPFWALDLAGNCTVEAESGGQTLDVRAQVVNRHLVIPRSRQTRSPGYEVVRRRKAAYSTRGHER